MKQSIKQKLDQILEKNTKMSAELASLPMASESDLNFLSLPKFFARGACREEADAGGNPESLSPARHVLCQT